MDTKLKNKALLIISLTLLCKLFSSSDMCNAEGNALGASVTVIGENGNVVEGNPALLGIAEKRHINVTTRLAGLSIENDSVIGLLVQSSTPIKHLAGTFGVNIFANFNTIESDEANGLAYAVWKAAAAYGFAINAKMQFGFTGSVKGTYVNKNFLENDDEIGTITPSFNLTAGLNIRPVRLLNIGILAANLISYFISKDHIDNAPGFFRAGIGLHIKTITIGTTATYTLHQHKFSYDLAARISLFQNRFRALIGMEIINYKGGFVPKIAFGATLGNIRVDYSFTYPVSGIFVSGDHKISFGIEY
jgi:hypothetical protein